MLTSVFRKLAVALTFALAFVVNPAYVAGCGAQEESEPDFGEAEMVALLDDINGMAATEVTDSEAVYEIDLALTQTEGDDVAEARKGSLFASSAYACGSRTFMQSASACITSTALAVEGTLSVRRVDGPEPIVVAEDIEVDGFLNAFGDRLGYATLDLTFEGGSARWVTKDDTLQLEIEAFDATELGEDAVDIAFH